VSAMKVTPNAAMRARDVSRPRPEHLAEAEAADARYLGGQRGGAAPAAPGQDDGARASRGAGRRDAGRGGRARDDGAAEGAWAQGGGRGNETADGTAGGNGAVGGGGRGNGAADGLNDAARDGGVSRGGGDAEGRRRRRITRAGRGRAAR
jgi:hypothetical protein